MNATKREQIEQRSKEVSNKKNRRYLLKILLPSFLSESGKKPFDFAFLGYSR